MTILWLALRSLRARTLATSLTIFSIALSVMLLVGVDRLRSATQAGFSGTISHTDLIVGARGGGLPLLLSSVFHIGAASNNISWASYQHFAQHKAVAWTIPISIGDSYRGFPVIATDENFYRHYQYRGGHSLALAEGHAATGLFDVALGSTIAKERNLHLGDKIVLAHGVEEKSILNHDNTPFTVVGILAQTATPVDRSLYITLLGEEAMHFGWSGGTPPAIGEAVPVLDPSKLQVDQITSFMLGAKSRVSTLYLQREIDTYKPEPLTSIIPAYTLQELWSLLDYADTALSLVSAAVLVVGLLAMLIALYTALNERRREIAVLRAVGLHAYQIFLLFVLESTFIAAIGTAIGIAAVYVLLYALRTTIETHFGLPIAQVGLSPRVELYAAATLVSAAILGLIPAFGAYRNSLVDGLNAR
ncbi:putative ABC transport system permease protein [Granulicella pectinivorans]|uniref:Putative ABC transport system permease protein n=1 Tax=Granulicella pectinivorans TaxID=474950 RepID=A0A1I6M432_9BACT|nr:FtsX-like permease family protein [Granulicella pectinivorans]SFS10413.1 putative ABC transport system permease protein [Granulicella pectinivorans]